MSGRRARYCGVASQPASGCVVEWRPFEEDTDANGQAVFTDLRITGPAVSYTIRFRSGALAEAPATVALTVGP